MNIVEMLEEIGMSKKEAGVYLALLKGGAMGAPEIAALGKMHRPNVYDVLKRLEQRSLVSSATINGKIFYRAASLESLRDFWEEKLKLVREMTRELEKYKPEEKECDVSVFTGVKALRFVEMDVIETLKKEGGELVAVGVDERKFFDEDNVAMKWFFERMKESQLKEKIIVCEGDEYLPAPAETTAYGMLPKKYFDSSASFFAYGSKVAIVLFSEELHVVAIKSRKVANAYRKKFELLWKNSRKVKRNIKNP